jgi:hypothetical protein
MRKPANHPGFFGPITDHPPNVKILSIIGHSLNNFEVMRQLGLTYIFTFDAH